MREPEEVAAMLKLHARGWGTRRIARELGVSGNTVKRYLAGGGWVAYRSPSAVPLFGGLEDWLKERFLRRRGNAEAIGQELLGEHGIAVSLRTVERAVEPWRMELLADGAGTQELRLEYCRPWEANTTPADVFSTRLRCADDEPAASGAPGFQAPRAGKCEVSQRMRRRQAGLPIACAQPAEMPGSAARFPAWGQSVRNLSRAGSSTTP
jgi:hypothetical protein